MSRTLTRSRSEHTTSASAWASIEANYGGNIRQVRELAHTADRYRFEVTTPTGNAWDHARPAAPPLRVVRPSACPTTSTPTAMPSVELDAECGGVA